MRGHREAYEAFCDTSFDLNLDRTLADEEGFFARYRPPHLRLVRQGEPVGILSDDDVSFLQTQQTLRLHAEGFDLPAFSVLHERIPQRLAFGERNMDFVAQLADKAHAQEPRCTAGNPSLSNAHVGKSFAREIHSFAQVLQHLACERSCDIHPREGSRAVDDLDLQVPLRPPKQQRAIDGIAASCRRRQVEVIGCKATTDAVVGDNPRFVRHQQVARASHQLFLVRPAVESVDELGGILAVDIDSA